METETITISTENHETYSAVSNFFIDYYMTKANGEYVKIYLYLVRLLNSGRAVTIADIADHFDLTETDICRAIRYWIKEKVLRLEYTSEKKLTGITMLPLKAKASKKRNNSLLSMLEADEEELSSADKLTAAAKEEPTKEPLEQEDFTVPKRTAYKAAYIEEKKNADEDFSDVLYQTEIYFGKPLTPTDLQILTYIHEELNFSPDLLAYLVDHCVTIGKKSSRYIEKAAIDWYTKGIATVEDAKAAAQNYNSIYVSVLKQLGIPRRVPTPTETNYIDTWYNTFAFDKSIINEACTRAIASNPHSANFKYVNGILESWHQQNVHKLSDIKELDKKWAAERKKQTTRRGGTVNQFNSYKNSTNDETIDEFASIFLNETNKK